MAAFACRKSRRARLFGYAFAFVIYTVAIVYLVSWHNDQNLKKSLLKSGARTGEGSVDSAKCDERPHETDRSLLTSSSSMNNTGRDDDYEDREKERTSGEFILQSTEAVQNYDVTSSGTTPKVIRLLCWVPTDPSILDRAKDARDTWMQGCDVRLIMSSKENKEFPAVGLNVSAGRDHIAEKSKAAWTYIYKNHRNDAEFFMKADPDSYVVVENLKRYLANRDPDEPAIYGHNLYLNYSGVHYVAGEAIVLGRESLNRLVIKGIGQSGCFPPGQGEDLKTCLCLSKVGGYTVDTRDEDGRETFLPPFSVEHIVTGKMPAWYVNTYRQPYGYCQSVDCLSHHPIAFHYVNRQQVFLMKYLFRSRLLQSSASDDHGQLRFNGTRYFNL